MVGIHLFRCYPVADLAIGTGRQTPAGRFLLGFAIRDPAPEHTYCQAAAKHDEPLPHPTRQPVQPGISLKAERVPGKQLRQTQRPMLPEAEGRVKAP